MKRLSIALLVLLIGGCQRGPGEVTNKVLQDFGLQKRPEGYVSGSDRVYEKLPTVGEAEIRRMNAEGRQGEIKYQEEGLRGLYYKEVKVYERCYPLDAQASSGGSQREDGPSYVGYIEYSYRYFQSARKGTRAEAEAESASIPTDVTGRETYRYDFNSGGNWDGSAGEKSRR